MERSDAAWLLLSATRANAGRPSATLPNPCPSVRPQNQPATPWGLMSPPKTSVLTPRLSQIGIIQYSLLPFRIVAALTAPEYVLLRARLAQARERAGLTQSQVAAQLRRAQSFVSKYESGERRLDVIDFIRVCAALNIAPTHVLDGLAAAGCGFDEKLARD